MPQGVCPTAVRELQDGCHLRVAEPLDILLMSPMTLLLAIALAAAESPAPTLRLGHYSSGNGLHGLVLDRTTTPVLARLDGSDEILVLTPEAAAYGDVALVRDDGVRLLRVDARGGARLALPGARDPIELYRDGEAAPLAPARCPDGGPASAAQASSQALAGLGVEGGVRLEGPAPEDAWVLCLAIAHAQLAVGRVAASSFGARAVRESLRSIRVRGGAFPGATVDPGGMLILTVKPDAGWRGSLSSYRIEEALLEGL